MSDSAMSSQLFGALGAGLSEAAVSFRNAMEQAQEQKEEVRLSEYWRNYGHSAWAEIEALRAQVAAKDAVIDYERSMKERALQNIRSFRESTTANKSYVDLLEGRIAELEETLQQQCANHWAYKQLAESLAKDLDASKPAVADLSINPDDRTKFLKEQWAHFMTTRNVKRGIPEKKPG